MLAALLTAVAVAEGTMLSAVSILSASRAARGDLSSAALLSLESCLALEGTWGLTWLCASDAVIGERRCPMAVNVLASTGE